MYIYVFFFQRIFQKRNFGRRCVSLFYIVLLNVVLIIFDSRLIEYPFLYHVIIYLCICISFFSENISKEE